MNNLEDGIGIFDGVLNDLEDGGSNSEHGISIFG